MKTTVKLFAIVLTAATLFQSCADELFRIEGEGRITTEVLSIPEFSSISMSGVDDVYISYGTEQRVEVTGHPNIIARIERNVYNETWKMKLENGSYGQYELTYYVTIPLLEKVYNQGTGDVIISSEFTQDYIDVTLEGTGDFKGFLMNTLEASVDIIGTGNCELTALEYLDVTIEGTGKVYYKGFPVIESDIKGTGRIINSND